jgi:hypothetical protein
MDSLIFKLISILGFLISLTLGILKIIEFINKRKSVIGNSKYIQFELLKILIDFKNPIVIDKDSISISNINSDLSNIKLLCDKIDNKLKDCIEFFPELINILIRLRNSIEQLKINCKGVDYFSKNLSNIYHIYKIIYSNLGQLSLFVSGLDNLKYEKSYLYYSSKQEVFNKLYNIWIIECMTESMEEQFKIMSEIVNKGEK